MDNGWMRRKTGEEKRLAFGAHSSSPTWAGAFFDGQVGVVAGIPGDGTDSGSVRSRRGGYESGDRAGIRPVGPERTLT